MRPWGVDLDLTALRNSNFRLLGLNRIGSVTAEQILTVAITVSVLNAGGDASAVGLVLAARGVASVLFLLAGGVWVDRLPRRRVMIFAYGGQALAASVLILMAQHQSVWALASVIFIAGAADAFIRPAFNAILSSVLADAQRLTGRALMSLCVRAGVIAGPGLAVALLAGAGSGAVFGVVAVLSVVVALLVWRMNEPPWTPVRGRSMVADLVAAFTEARRHPWLVALLLFSPISLMLVIAPAQVLLPIVSRDSFGSYTAFGTALACFGVGGLIASLVALAWRPRSPGTIAMWSMALYGLVPIALLYAPNIWFLLGSYLVAGLGVETYALHWDVALQREIPNHLIGRITALAWLSSFGLMPFGLALTGPLVNFLGTPIVLGLAAALALIVPPCLLVAINGMTQFRTVPDARSQKEGERNAF